MWFFLSSGFSNDAPKLRDELTKNAKWPITPMGAQMRACACALACACACALASAWERPNDQNQRPKMSNRLRDGPPKPVRACALAGYMCARGMLRARALSLFEL